MRKRYAVVVAFFFLLAFMVGAACAGGLSPKLAPLSDAFLTYRENMVDGSAVTARTGEETSYGTGYVPSPLDLSHLRGADYSAYFGRSASAREALPASYNLEKLGFVTSVKNQGTYNSCWAFSAIGAIESNYLMTANQALDLSEMHLFWYAFKDSPGLTPLGSGGEPGGGWDNSAVSTLARWTGPVLEQYAPYGTTPTGLSSSYQQRLHLQGAFFLSLQFDAKSEFQPTNDVRKRLLMDYGAISVGCMSPSGSSYNGQNYTWNTDVSQTANHAVLLVGWDDNYPRDNFNVKPRSNGAWLVRNSWGTSFGDNGYYWISYEDKVFSDGVAYQVEETDNYDRNYGYDDLGWCNSLGVSDTSSPYVGNVFTAASQGEELRAVSFYTTAPNASYEIFVYTGIPEGGAPTNGTLAARQSGSEAFAGYHTVKLSAPVSLAKGSRFSVVLKMTTPSYSYPLAVEVPVKYFSDAAISNRGESYFSSDGSTWHDAKDLALKLTGGSHLNACIRAFTSVTDTAPVDVKAFSDDPADWGAVVIDLGTSALVRIYGKIVSDTLPTDINAKVGGGLNVIRGLIGDSQGYPVSGGSNVTVRSATGNRYLVIEGTATSAAAAQRATIESLAYNLGGVRVSQFEGSAISVAEMTPREAGPGDYTNSNTGGSGGGGCNSGLGGLVLVLFGVMAVRGKKRI